MTLRERLDALSTEGWVEIRRGERLIVEVRIPPRTTVMVLGGFTSMKSALNVTLEHAKTHNLYWIAHPVCFGCLKYHELFMVQNDIWRSANLPFNRGSICWPCLEELVGRPFQLDDFTNVPANGNIRLAWARGRADQEKTP